MSEYESVNRGWARVGEDGILRAVPQPPQPDAPPLWMPIVLVLLILLPILLVVVL